MLDLEDKNFEKHILFFFFFYKEREIYNLTEYDIKLMKAVVSSIFVDVDEEKYINLHSLYFSSLNSLVPKSQLDYSYYNAKIKSIYLQDEKNILSESEIEKLFKEIENKNYMNFIVIMVFTL